MILGSSIGNSNCCANPKRRAIFPSYSHLSTDDSAISNTLPMCLPSARAPISFKNWNSERDRAPSTPRGCSPSPARCQRDMDLPSGQFPLTPVSPGRSFVRLLRSSANLKAAGLPQPSGEAPPPCSAASFAIPFIPSCGLPQLCDFRGRPCRRATEEAKPTAALQPGPSRGKPRTRHRHFSRRKSIASRSSSSFPNEKTEMRWSPAESVQPYVQSRGWQGP